MPVYTLDYLFNGEPRRHAIDLQQTELAVPDAAMHLLELHVGDAENSLIMPSADATSEQILQQAEVVGITQVNVARQSGNHPSDGASEAGAPIPKPD